MVASWLYGKYHGRGTDPLFAEMIVQEAMYIYIDNI